MDTETGQDRQDTRTAPRRRRGLVIGSVAASVLLVAGGGAYVSMALSGNDSSGPADSAGAEPPKLPLDIAAGSDSSSSAERGDPGIAPGEPNPSGSLYRATGELPAGPGSAAVHRAQGDVTSAEVTKLAKALGLKGTPHMSGGTWQVGPSDGSAPKLQVARQAPGSWTLDSSGSPGGGSECPEGKMCASGTGIQSDALPDESRAEDKARPVLEAIGIDVKDAEVSAGGLVGSSRAVSADPQVGGLPTEGWTTTVHVAFDGKITGGNGFLKTPQKDATYPVLSAKKTLEALNRTGGTHRGGGKDTKDVCPTGEKGQGGKAAGGGGKVMSDGKNDGCVTTPAEQDPTKVKKAVFGLAAQSSEGRQILVPSWIYTVRAQGASSDFTVTHPAVDPKFLTTPDSGQGEDRPDPRPEHKGNSVNKIETYSADGRQLTVRVYGSVCSTYKASASEKGAKVTVQVAEHTPDGKEMCVKMAKEYELRVTLDKPLGDRKVVDTKGQPVEVK